MLPFLDGTGDYLDVSETRHTEQSMFSYVGPRRVLVCIVEPNLCG